MADETVADSSSNSWRLLRDELEFVAQYTKDLYEAKAFLVRELDRHSIRFRPTNLKLGPGWTYEAALRYAWLPDPDGGRIGLDVRWEQSSVIRRGPPVIIRPPSALKAPWPKGVTLDAYVEYDLDHPESLLEMRLVQVWHPDSIQALRHAGLLPPQDILQETTGPKLPKQWINDAVKVNPKAKNESHAAYARRLSEAMQTARQKNEVTKRWAEGTIAARLRETRKARQKADKKPAKGN